MAAKHVINPHEVWPAQMLVFWSFVAGLSVYLWVVITLVVVVLQNWQPPPNMMVAVPLMGICIPWTLLWRFQSMVRTRSRALLSGAACALGAVSLSVVFSIGNPDWRHWLGLAGATVTLILFYSLSNIVLLVVFNKLRPLPPIQDGTLCPGCGYCLIGNKSMICPECGRPFTFTELRAPASPSSRSGLAPAEDHHRMSTVTADPNASPVAKRLSADDLYWEEVEAARQEPLEDKLLDGPRLFDRACRIMRDGIRSQCPAATDEEVERILLERLEIAQRLETWP